MYSRRVNSFTALYVQFSINLKKNNKYVILNSNYHRLKI